MSLQQLRRQYLASIETVECYGRVAYEVLPEHGVFHVTVDPTGNSHSCHDLHTTAMREAIRLNRNLVYILDHRPV